MEDEGGPVGRRVLWGRGLQGREPERPERRARAVAWSIAGPSVEIIKASQMRNWVWNGRE
jgi:hypothetical protein